MDKSKIIKLLCTIFICALVFDISLTPLHELIHAIIFWAYGQDVYQIVWFNLGGLNFFTQEPMGWVVGEWGTAVNFAHDVFEWIWMMGLAGLTALVVTKDVDLYY